MSINFKTNIITGTVAYAKILVPSKKYGKENEYELCIDVFVSEDDADLWDDKFPKQKARQVKTAEFEGIYKIPAPFPDQKKQYAVRVKRDTTYKDGNPVPKEYWPKVLMKINGKRRDISESFIEKKIGVGSGSICRVSFEINENDYGVFARLKNVLVDSLVEYKSRMEAGDEFGDEDDEEGDEFDTPNNSVDKESVSGDNSTSSSDDPDEDSPF